MSVEDGIPEGGQATPPEPTHDWEKDYKELQATYTQSQQRLKDLERYEQDPTAFLDLGKKQGWIEIDEPAPDPTIDPRLAQTQQELAEMREWRQQVEAERQQQQVAAGEQQFHTGLDDVGQGGRREAVQGGPQRDLRDAPAFRRSGARVRCPAGLRGACRREEGGP
jgi:hypothetical protein